ncbi:hypothetical protein Tco_0805022 [Tanacetum coccineum]
MSTLKFAETHNLVAFLEKPEESNGFEEIIDSLNTSSVQYALMVNPTIYTTCIEQFWTSVTAKTVYGERQIQALVDKTKVIITETSIRSDLKLDDVKGTYCLPTATIFAELERIGAKTTSWNKFSSTMASAIIFFLDKQVEGMSKHKGIYVIPFLTKKVFANMKRPGKGFSGKVTPLFKTMMVQATKDMEPIPDKAINEEHVATLSCDPSQSGGDRMQLTRLMDLCTQLQSRVLALETTKSNQALEIESLKRRVKSLEKRRKSRTPGFKRLRKVGSASRVESSNDVSLGAQEDASKQGRKIADLDADAEVTLVDETQEMNDDNLMFDTGVLEEQEIKFEKVVEEPVVSVAKTTKSIPVSAADPVTTAGEVVTTANVEVTTASAPTTTIDELTLAQTLIEIKAAKPKAVTSAATTTTITRPKARGVAKDKGNEKMVEPEKSLKKKYQIAMDKEVARNLKAQLQAELEEEEMISRLKEEEANIALLESWDNTQAIMDADF